jgi:predicted transcriptional regulator
LSFEPYLNRGFSRAFPARRPPTVDAVRSVDLALYADELAARAATLAAQLEWARCRLRQEAIEREARRALGEGSVVRLEALGLIRRFDAHAIRLEIRELAASVAVVEELQAWVEEQLADVQAELPAA